MEKPNFLPNQPISDLGGVPKDTFYRLIRALIDELGGFGYQGADPIFQFGEGTPASNGISSGHFYRDLTAGAEKTYHFKSGAWVEL